MAMIEMKQIEALEDATDLLQNPETLPTTGKRKWVSVLSQPAQSGTCTRSSSPDSQRLSRSRVADGRL